MDNTSIGMILILIVLVFFSAFFSASETAISSLNKIRLKNRAENGDRKAALAYSMAENYDSVISSILIANNIVNITAASIGTVLFTRLVPAYGPTVSTIVLTVGILIFGEITPKCLAKERAEDFAISSASTLKFFITILTPLNFFFGLWRDLASRMFQAPEDDGITEEELITMVEEAENEGGLEHHESELIRAAIEFNDLEVSEILIPRVDIVAAADASTMEELGVLFAESGFSRLPIYSGSVDNIVGIIHEKDFLSARYHNIGDIKSLLAEVLYTTGTAKISSLLHILQRRKSHMAIVVDEYGGTEGLVTLEDILEELVGEIWDEHDEVIEEFRKQPDGSYLISCSANLADLFDHFSLRDNKDFDSNSVSGWVLEQMGRLPVEGDHFVYEDLDVTVTKVDNRRVLEIQVTVLPETNASEK